jgi:hypothetical protein
VSEQIKVYLKVVYEAKLVINLCKLIFFLYQTTQVLNFWEVDYITPLSNKIFLYLFFNQNYNFKGAY